MLDVLSTATLPIAPRVHPWRVLRKEFARAAATTIPFIHHAARENMGWFPAPSQPPPAQPFPSLPPPSSPLAHSPLPSISTPSPSISDNDKTLTSTPSTSPEKLVMPTSSPIMFATEGPSITIARKDSSYPSISPEMRPASSPAVLPLEGLTSGETSSLVNVVGVRGLVIVLLMYDFLY